MTLTPSEKERLMDESLEIIEELGGVKGIRDGFAEMDTAWRRMDREGETLLKLHPDKWVAMSKDGVVAVDDSLEGVFSKVDTLGLRRNSINVKFIATQPRTLIL